MQYTRFCPVCQKEISYATKGSRDQLQRLQKSCRSCSSKEISSRPKVIENRKKCFLYEKGSKKPEENGFYGRKHSVETKEKQREIKLGTTHTDATKKKLHELHSGSNNPMFGKSIKDVWIEKYGTEEANQREQQWLEKLSLSMSGSGNPMYGKPSPKGCGNGWKGWYRGFFFRSLRELCYMIYLDESGISWISGEKLSIPYIDWKGSDRTCRPDFILEDGTIVEIKPKRLHNSPSVSAKKEAIKDYCKKEDIDFLMIDVDINQEKIISNLDNIKWSSDYEKRFQQYVQRSEG